MSDQRTVAFSAHVVIPLTALIAVIPREVRRNWLVANVAVSFRRDGGIVTGWQVWKVYHERLRQVVVWLLEVANR